VLLTPDSHVPHHKCFPFIKIVEKLYNSCVFINIVAKFEGDIFYTFVFNNIVRLTFILGPPFFPVTLAASEQINSFKFNGMEF
jgi:hypothetical protein